MTEEKKNIRDCGTADTDRDEMPKKIFLIGFMGCGKSTAASALEAIYGYNRIEMDKEIEAGEKRPISRIFEEEGEPYFRNLETAFLRNLAKDRRNLVVSCGGGAALREENVKLMKEQGVIVYLTAAPDTILKRTRNSHKRPLLEGNKNLSYIKDLLDKRRSFYEKAADIQISTDERKISDICRDIMDSLL